MNFFQRLSYVKKWYLENTREFRQHIIIKKQEFDQFYRQEVTELRKQSAQLRKKINDDIDAELAMSYEEWVEKYFQGMIKRISNSVLEKDKLNLTDDFKIWLKNYSKLDYNLRTIGLKRFFDSELYLFDKEIDLYLQELKEMQVFWAYEEEEKFQEWLERHPLYNELKKLEFLYDNMNDHDTVTKNSLFNDKSIQLSATRQKRIIDSNMYNLKDVDIQYDLARPVIIDYQEQYF